MKIYSFLCIVGSVFTENDERIWNIIDEANDRKESIEKNTLQSMQNSFAIENLEATVSKQNVQIYEQSKSLLVLKDLVDEQNKVLENQKILIETLSNDLNQTHLQQDVTAAELNDLKKDFDANDFDPCVRTCNQSLEGKTQWIDYNNVSIICLNSQAPELYRGPRARCARSGENGEDGV